MSDEITVGHYAMYPNSIFDKLREEIKSLHSEKQTLQQVVFERDKVIMELRAELAIRTKQLNESESECADRGNEIEQLQKAAQDDGAFIDNSGAMDVFQHPMAEVFLRYEKMPKQITLGQTINFSNFQGITGKWIAVGFDCDEKTVHLVRELPTPPEEKG